MFFHKKSAITSTLLFISLALIFLFGDRLPFIRVTLGDFIVVIFVYTFLTALFAKLSPLKVGTVVLFISFSVEFLQMGVISKLFDTSSPIVAATLGSTFDPHDLIAYTLGTAVAILIDIKLLRNGIVAKNVAK